MGGKLMIEIVNSWLKDHQALIDFLSLAFLAVYVAVTWTMQRSARRAVKVAQDTLAEMKVAREAQEAASIVVLFDVSNDFRIHLLIKNVGRSIARDVQLQFDPPLKSTLAEDDPIWGTTVIRSLAPGSELRSFIDLTHNFFQRKMPLVYQVSVGFNSVGSGRRFSTEQTLDLSPYEHITVISEKTIGDVFRKFEELVNETKGSKEQLEQIRDQLHEGLLIKNIDGMSYSIPFGPEGWSKLCALKIGHFVNMWHDLIASVESSKRWTYLPECRGEWLLVAAHIRSALSLGGNLVDTILAERVSGIASDIAEVAMWHCYAGQLTIEGARERGDAICEKAEQLIEVLDPRQSPFPPTSGENPVS
jgi:hypothetical protein